VCLCIFLGFILYGRLVEYTFYRNEISRQTDVLNSLQNEDGQPSIRILSAPETINHFSEQICNFGLSEVSLFSEMSDSQFYAWEKWHIDAICTGPLENIYAFVEALESSDKYFDLDFSIYSDDENLKNISINLVFYANN